MFGNQNGLPGDGNLAHMAIWIVIFGSMSLLGKTDGQHTGDSLPFWQEACTEGRANSCERLLQLQSTYCGDNAAWACNELGAHTVKAISWHRMKDLALAYFTRACGVEIQGGLSQLA